MICICVCLSLLCTGCARQTLGETATGYVLIDPGHGGFDGGAVAADGTLEKHINLEIGLYLRDMLAVCGLPVFMTRSTDEALISSDAGSTRNKKVSDMTSRLSLYNGAEAVISIHQNYFEIPKYTGTQVFYSANRSESVRLAQAVQDSVVSGLQPDNDRQIKKATDGIYLMHHSTVPAVLVECGFLSNSDELAKLKTPEYRQQLAFAIMVGYWNYSMEK